MLSIPGIAGNGGQFFAISVAVPFPLSQPRCLGFLSNLQLYRSKESKKYFFIEVLHLKSCKVKIVIDVFILVH